MRDIGKHLFSNVYFQTFIVQNMFYLSITCWKNLLLQNLIINFEVFGLFIGFISFFQKTCQIFKTYKSLSSVYRKFS